MWACKSHGYFIHEGNAHLKLSFLGGVAIVNEDSNLPNIQTSVSFVPN